FKRARKPLPIGKELTQKTLVLKFSSTKAASGAYDIIRNKYPEFGCKRKEDFLTIVLSTGEESRIRASAVEQAVHVLRTRLDTVNVRGLAVHRHGDSNVVVQLPGVDDVDDIKSTIMRAARLEFKIVEKQGYKDSLLDAYDGVFPPDKMLVPHKGADDDEGIWYVVSVFPDMVGNRITDARLGYDQTGRPAVNFTLDSEGGREFRDLTRRNIGRSMAIIMDEHVISAAGIHEEIASRGANITGMRQEEAVKIASLLRSGALPAPLKLEQESRVGASLGTDSVRQGLISCLVALALLFVFSLIYYRTAGFLAFIALIYNLFVLLLALSYFKATLTLPGIAGMVLTVGMAIDASILIYERIREELLAGSPFRKAVHEGFNGAMKVILDSNITTFISGIVLFWLGGPAIRGFAVTLMVGVISTVIAGVYFLKALFDFVTDTLEIRKVGI
ncbi:protein translocase subunit SecD, partial [Candidatus Dependentiae bacterium]